jgi:superfamily II DNA helicase RecQ
MKGVTICLIPLLSLGADQVNKAMMKTRNDPSKAITAFHLDELEDTDLNELLILLSEVDAGCTTILYSSPQFLVDRCPTFFNRLMNLGILRFVCVDEIHLFSHFGRSFRQEFNKLKSSFFAKLPNMIPCLFLTATCTRCIKESFETSLTCIGLQHIKWQTEKCLFLFRIHQGRSQTCQNQLLVALN